MSTVQTQPPQTRLPTPVTVTDINMPFVSMVFFMVKWAFATIPALLILGAIGLVMAMVFGGLLAGALAAP